VRVPRSSLRLLLSASFALISGSFVSAQITNVTNTTSTPIPGAGHDYIKLLSETVNPSNGSVSLRIQAPTPPGRKISLPFSFAYDSNGAQQLVSDGVGGLYWTDNWSYPAGSGWSYSVPMLSNAQIREMLVPGHGGPAARCIYDGFFVMQDATGGRHALALSLVENPLECPWGTPIIPIQRLSGGDDYYEAALTINQLPALVADADGTVYTFPQWNNQIHLNPNNSDSSIAAASLPSTIEDRNGNILTLTDLGAQTGGKYGSLTVKDTLGRTMISTSGFGFNGDTVSIAGLSNPYTVTWGTTSVNYSMSSSLLTSPPGQCWTSFPADVHTMPVITAISLPNNTFYHLTYDPVYGVVNKVTYPSGGYVSYTWGISTLAEFSNYPDSNGAGSCDYHHDTPVVLHRYVSFDGLSIALQQDFTYTTTWSGNHSQWTTKTTSVKTTDLVTGAISTNAYTYLPISVPRQPNDRSQYQPQVAVEQTIAYKNSSGSTLRTITKAWFDQYELQSEKTTLEDAVTFSLTTYTYGPGAQVTSESDFDFPSGTALIRKTVNNYQAFSATPLFPSAASIFDKPCNTIVYDSSGTNRVAESDYFYDGSSSTTPCSAATTQTLLGSGSYTGHDENHYGTAASAPRGNLTNSRRRE